MSYNEEAINLNKLIEDVILLYRENYKSKNIKFININNNNLFVLADKFMLQTIFRNFISNAIKYTKPNGFIQISAEIKNDIVEMCIADNGVGMKKEQVDNLFKIVKNKSKPGTNKEKGSGLGMLLAKEFLNLHRAKIKIISEPQKGTKIYFTLKKETNNE